MKKYILISLLLIFSIQGIAQEIPEESNTSQEEMFDLSMEDLMNVTVESATKSSVSLQKAPSIIRVYTDKDIEKFGFITLRDVLNSIPGVMIQENKEGQQGVWIRGVQAEYNEKMLFLIDGVPMRDLYTGNFNVDEMVPLENVEKVDVLNGPGSVLYGTNAFAGVISITTKSKGKSVQVAYGSFNRIEAYGEYDVGGLYVSGKYYSSDGFQPEYMSDGLQRTVNQRATLGYGNIKYSRKDLTIGASISSYKYPFKYHETNRETQYTRTPITAYFRYNPKLSETSSLNIQTYINTYLFKEDEKIFTGTSSDTLQEHVISNFNTQLLGSEITYNKQAGKHSLVFGNAWFIDRGLKMGKEVDPHAIDTSTIGDKKFMVDPNVARSTIGFYVHDIYEINEYFNLTGGLRYDILSDFDDEFSYRFALTGQKGNFYGKALYGTAYRVPTYEEYLLIGSPNPDIQSERLNTLELQIGYVAKKMDINLTYFDNSYTNFIQKFKVDSMIVDGSTVVIDDVMAFNFKDKKTNGFELSANMLPVSGLVINGGVTMYLNATMDHGELDPNVFFSDVTGGVVNLTFLSSFSSHLNVNYTVNSKYTFGLNTLLMGDRNIPGNYQNDVPDAVKNPDNANGFVKIDFVSRIRLLPTNKLQLTLRLDNLLNSKIYSPPYLHNTGYDTEWAGLTFRAGAVFKF